MKWILGICLWLAKLVLVSCYVFAIWAIWISRHGVNGIVTAICLLGITATFITAIKETS
jgi:uncharacterized membrane protein YqjE